MFSGRKVNLWGLYSRAGSMLETLSLVLLFAGQSKERRRIMGDDRPNPLPSIEFSSDLIRLMRTASSLAVLTGAGVSAESGIPTFREAQSGLWSRYDPTQLATPEAFQENPELVWSWYQWRRDLINNNAPNPAHHTLVKIEQKLPSFTLITQNVDGFHRQAGSGNVLELHGNIHTNLCSREKKVVISRAEDGRMVPTCPDCGAKLRPGVVWFGESLPVDALRAAQEAAASSDIFLSIGTSGLVQPAASLPLIALEAGKIVLEINPSPTPLTPYSHFAIHGPAGEVLPELYQAIWYT